MLIWLQSHELGTDSTYPTYVAIMGTVFDVSGNTAYAPKNPYNGVYADHSRTEQQMPKALKNWQKSQPADLILSPLVFAGKDASRALAQSSLKMEDCRSDWEDLPDDKKAVLQDWFTFFSKRYNIVGKVQG